MREWRPKVWEWGADLAEAFRYICEQIRHRAIKTMRREAQFHIAVNTSGTGIGAILAQLREHPVGNPITDKTIRELGILSFISCKLKDVETRYHAAQREALGIVRALAECKPLIQGSPSPLLVYTNHLNFKTFVKYGRVSLYTDFGVWNSWRCEQP